MHSVKVKQQYVSTKKGSDYQLHKESIETTLQKAGKNGILTEEMIEKAYMYEHPAVTDFNNKLRKENKKKVAQKTLEIFPNVTKKQKKKKKKNHVQMSDPIKLRARP